MDANDKALEWARRREFLSHRANYLQRTIFEANEKWVRSGRRVYADTEVYAEMLDVIGDIESLTGKPWAEALSE